MRNLLPPHLLLAALVGASVIGVPAAAAAADPYPGTVGTSCTVDLDASAADRRLSAVIDVAASGNAPVRGTLVAVFGGPGGTTMATKRVDYEGGRVVVAGPKAVDKGRYLATVGFEPRTGSVYTSCADEDGVDVGVGGIDDGDDDGNGTNGNGNNNGNGADPQGGQSAGNDGVLPDTGGQPAWMPIAGAGLVLLGLAMLLLRRRRASGA